MEIYLGKDEAGKDFHLNLKKEGVNIILLLGETGSGKSIFHENLYKQIAANNTPEEVGFVFLDMTRVHFSSWRKSPYLYCPVTEDVNEAVNLLEKLAEESRLRAKVERDKSRTIFVHIEECAMFATEPERTYNAVAEISAHKDKNNMYLVFSTSKLGDRDFLTDLLRLEDLKVVFRTSVAEDSNFLLGNETTFNFTQPGERILAFKNKQVCCQPFTQEEVKELEKQP